jgi:flagellar biogenesis protein FliO
MLADVEILFTTLLLLAIVGVVWFSVYVVYRLYSDNR